VLSTDLDAPRVSDTTVRTDALQPLEVLAELALELVGKELAVLAVNDILLPVEEPRRDLVLRRVLEDGDNSLELIRVELSGALGKVDIGLLAHDVRVSPSDTLDLGQSVHDLALSIDVGVQQTENVLERLVLL